MSEIERTMLRDIDGADHYVEDALLASVRCRMGLQAARRAIRGLLASERIERIPESRNANGDLTTPAHYRTTAWGRMSL